MNKYLENLNRIEFVVTMACTGRCIHCSEGEHKLSGKHIDGDIAVQAVIDICNNYDIKSLMTFGGEPLIYPEVVCNIHKTAKEMNIKDRAIITNGFFSKDKEVMDFWENLMPLQGEPSYDDKKLRKRNKTEKRWTRSRKKR